jgi:hypothetical protein
MLNCHEATQLMSEAQERQLPLAERMSLRLHLMMCGGCHNFRQHMDAIRSMARAYAKGKNEQEKK